MYGFTYLQDRVWIFFYKKFTGCERRMHLLIYLLIFRPGHLYKQIQDKKIRILVFIRSLYDLFEGFYELLTIMQYACRRIFSGLSEDAFGALASLAITCIYALVQFLVTNNFCSQSLTWCFIKSILLKKSSTHMSVNRIPFMRYIVSITY